MPDRIIRSRILSSESLAALSHPAERLFYRLVVLVDDFGRYHGSPQYIRHAAMPLLEVSNPDVGRWLAELRDAEVVCVYSVDGRQYVQFRNWSRYQRLRSKSSKFPEHRGCDCGHPRASADTCRPESESESESESETESETESSVTRPVEQNPSVSSSSVKAAPESSPQHRADGRDGLASPGIARNGTHAAPSEALESLQRIQAKAATRVINPAPRHREAPRRASSAASVAASCSTVEPSLVESRVDEIVNLTGDRKDQSLRFFRRMSGSMTEGQFRKALAETREAMRDGKIEKPGAIFVTKAKQALGDRRVEQRA